MEITSFVLGMLTIVAAGISASIVVGLAKINKLNKQLDNLSQQHERDLIHIFKVIGEKDNEIWRQFGDTSRDITMVEKTIINAILSRFLYRISFKKFTIDVQYLLNRD
jgi:hypothetical protein